jgi:uncharacterized membrane protein
MAAYLMADYDIGIMDAIEESKQMMKGHKLDLFILELTFIGWSLLCAVPMIISIILIATPFGGLFVLLPVIAGFLATFIGYLFLGVYMYAAEAVFYLNVSADRMGYK